MPTVVADTGPLRYLVLIGDVAILPALFGELSIPPEVRAELDRPTTPEPVRSWIATPPPWLRIRSGPAFPDTALAPLDPGERAAIALAEAIGADAILMDDRAGVAAARTKGLVVVGTLGVLDRAARRGLLDLPAAFSRLQATNFRYPPQLLGAMLSSWERENEAT